MRVIITTRFKSLKFILFAFIRNTKHFNCICINYVQIKIKRKVNYWFAFFKIEENKLS